MSADAESGRACRRCPLWPGREEVIPASPDVADMTEDDVMLIQYQKGSQEESGMAEPVGDLALI